MGAMIWTYDLLDRRKYQASLPTSQPQGTPDVLDRERTLAAIDVMVGAMEGRVVEAAARVSCDVEWHVCDCPVWNWAMMDYRLAPRSSVSTFRPYTTEELLKLIEIGVEIDADE